jgi:hypothetical protein
VVTVNEFRVSADGVVAVHDVRLYGGASRPWSVVWIPPGHRAHWPSMPLHQQDVAAWSVMEAKKARGITGLPLPVVAPGKEWAVRHCTCSLLPQSENAARFTHAQIPGSVLVHWDGHGWAPMDVSA